MTERVYLSRRNLQTLLSKLDRLKRGEYSVATLIKYDNPCDPFRPSMDSVLVVAIEDDRYYTARAAGDVHPKDDPDLKKEEAG